MYLFVFLQADDGIRDRVAYRGLGYVYKSQGAFSYVLLMNQGFDLVQHQIGLLQALHQHRELLGFAEEAYCHANYRHVFFAL